MPLAFIITISYNNHLKSSSLFQNQQDFFFVNQEVKKKKNQNGAKDLLLAVCKPSFWN